MVYKVVICKYCKQQAQWWKLDRAIYSWQCNNTIHGHKYLSKQEIEEIEVVEKSVIDKLIQERDQYRDKYWNAYRESGVY